MTKKITITTVENGKEVVKEFNLFIELDVINPDIIQYITNIAQFTKIQ